MRHQTSVLLKKGVDTKKDQSYVLYILTQDILNKLILPLGGYLKKDVREMGESFFPEAAERGESQEICFIQGKNYPDFIQEFVAGVTESGPIIDPSGAIIGKHKGIYGYTIGQRRGLGIASPEPLYVAGIDIGKNIVYAGPRDSIKKKECHVHALNWIRPLSRHPAMSVGTGLKGPADSFRATVKVRSTMKDEPATIYFKTNPSLPPSAKGGREGLSGEIVRVVFDEPQWAPAPGQSAVFYDGDVVIGGGIIKAKS
jgi:tRNA-specific 2-thiouridylase